MGVVEQKLVAAHLPALLERGFAQVRGGVPGLVVQLSLGAGSTGAYCGMAC